MLRFRQSTTLNNRLGFATGVLSIPIRFTFLVVSITALFTTILPLKPRLRLAVAALAASARYTKRMARGLDQVSTRSPTYFTD